MADKETQNQTHSDRLGPVDIAWIFWEILSRSKNAPAQAIRLRKLLPDAMESGSVGDMYQQITDGDFINLFGEQPQNRRLRRVWHKLFETGRDIPTADAILFVNEILEAMGRHISTVFGDRNLAGRQVCERNRLGDIRTTRNAGVHAGWSLHLTTGGEGQYECVRTRFRSTRGDMLLLSPDAPYDYGRAEGADRWTHDWVHFSPTGSLLKWLNWPELGPNIYHTHVPDEVYPVFADLFETLLPQNPNTGPQEAALFSNLVEQVLIRAQVFVPQTALPFTETRVNDAKAFILKNLSEPLSVEDVAHHVKLSRTRLSDLFKRSTGQTLTAWRDERRLAQAIQMLLHSDLSVAAVADEVGFSDPLYFSRKFKQALGVSPRAYRTNREPVA